MAVLSIAPEARVVMTCNVCAWWEDVTTEPGWGRFRNAERLALHDQHYWAVHQGGPWPTFQLRGIDTIGLYLPGTTSRHIPPFTVIDGQRVLCDKTALIHEKFWWDPETRRFVAP